MDPRDLSPPPPSYFEQDFDRKVSDALEASLSTPQPQHGDEEEWEEWDDAVHATAAQAIASLDNNRSSGSGPSHSLGARSRLVPDKKVHPAIEPLRIQKKAQNPPHSPPDQAKARPRWFAETETGTQSSTSGSSTIQHDIPPEDDEDHSIPPPPFTSVNPSLDSDGRPVIIMAYHPSGESRPPSPLNSPVRVPLAIPAHGHESMSLSRPPSRIQPEPERFRPNDQTARPARRSLPTVPHRSLHVGQRPSTAYVPKPQQSPSIPRINFDPYMAYNYEEGLPHARLPIQHFEPNAFYKYGQLSFYNCHPLTVSLVRLCLPIYQQRGRLPDSRICELYSSSI
jgi:hypothetical protein